MRTLAALLCLLVVLPLAGCGELEFEKDAGSGSSGGDVEIGNVLVTINVGTTGSIKWVNITITRASDGSVETLIPFIFFPFSQDIVVEPGDYVSAQAELISNGAIVTMQMRDNPAVVLSPRTYASKQCTAGTCITTVAHQF